MMKFLRGGSWLNLAMLASRSALRSRGTSTSCTEYIGLRVVCTKKERWFSSMIRYIRGDSWNDYARYSRSANRDKFTSTYRNDYTGLRAVCTKKERWFDSMMQYLRGGSWNDVPKFCRSADWGKCYPVSRSNDTGFRATSDNLFGNLVHIPAGRFMMGSPATEAGRFKDEEQREVVIDPPFL